MPDILLLESGIGGYLTEDGLGVLALEDGTGPTGIHPAVGNAVGYVVELFAAGAYWGPGVKLCELSGVRNLGWSQYDRLAGKAFFTLSQNDPNLQYIVRNKTHVAITRVVGSVATRVYSGQVVDYTSTADDVVVTCTDYIGLLSLSRCGYRTMYTSKKLGSEIVTPEWGLVKYPTDSILAFVATGTIEDPLAVDGVTPITTDTQFGLLDQSRLRLFYDISEMGRANTTNIVTFGITRTPPHTFYFYKNAGATRDMAFDLNGRVVDYSYSPNWSSYRNDFATLAQDANGGAAEIVSKDDTAAVAEGRRQDVFNIGTLLGLSTGTTVNSQQKAAVDRVLVRGLNPLPSLSLQLDEGSFDPFVGNELNDRFPVEIVHGIDNIHSSYRFAGVQAFFDNSGEKMTLQVTP